MQTNKTFLLILLVGCFFSSPQLVSGQSGVDWATYYGDNTWDWADAMATDDSGNIYISGFTLSPNNIASTNAFQIGFGGSTAASNVGDAFLLKMNCNGTRQWATYYGGAAGERGWSVACDKWGNVYLAGVVNDNFGGPTTNLTTPNGFQTTFGGGSSDLFLVKFNGAGQQIWATYYGGSGNESALSTNSFQPCAVTCDAGGNVYLTGATTSSAGIATTGAAQSTLAGGQDGFIVKFDSSGQRLWATYFGDTGNDRPCGIATDKSGNVAITGITNSTANIASTGAAQGSYGGGSTDGFIAKYNGVGFLIWSSYYGGSDADESMSISCDTSGNVIVAGRTKSPNGISSSGSYQSAFGGGLWDGFLVKLDPAGQRLWGTYYGGIHQGAVYGYNALATNDSGFIYLAGAARDLDSLSTPGSYQPVNAGVDDALLAKFDNNGQVIWSTYYGGSGADFFYGVSIDRFGHVFATGRTVSTTNIATAGGYQASFGGGSGDAFIVKFDDGEHYSQPDSVAGPVTVCRGETITFHASATAAAEGYTWTLPSGWSLIGSGSGDSITATVGTAGNGLSIDTLKVRADYTCGSSMDTFLLVMVAPEAQIAPAGTQQLCSGDSITLVANTQAVTSWQWLYNGQSIANAADSVLTVTQSGTYTVVTTNVACTDTSVADTVIVHSLPQPVISMSGNTLSTGSYAAYQWYHNAAAITGATNQTYTMIAITGSYAVEVTDTNGCKAMSADYMPTGITSMNGYPGIRFYPNPVKDVLVIDVPYKVAVTIRSIDGKTLQQFDEVKQVNMSGYAAGLYFLRFTDKEGAVLCERKLVKE